MTVKVRSGWDDDCLNAMDIARLAADEGAAMLAVHGRTRRQLYSGDADWDVVARIRDELPIPVIGSGDIVTPTDAMRRLAGGYADGVMIGRGAMGNPWIFAEVASVADGRPVAPPAPTERVEALHRFRVYLEEAIAERGFQGRFRGFACRMVKGLRGSAQARRAIGAAANCDEVETIFADFVLDSDCETESQAAVA
jgi:tRNA-dihydrouridine synthase B